MDSDGQDSLERRAEVFREAGKPGEEALVSKAAHVQTLWEANCCMSSSLFARLPGFLGDPLEP